MELTDKIQLKEDETLDVLEDEGLCFLQPRRGYRFSVDALLLARFARIPAGGLVADLGTGCGVVASLLARRPEVRSVVGIELQPYLARLARRNAVLNNLQDKVCVVVADLRQVERVFRPASFAALVVNPPYYPAGSGRLNPETTIALARHELSLTLPELARACAYLVKPRGRVNVVFLASRLVELMVEFRRLGLEPKQLQLVHGDTASPASLVLASFVPAARAGVEVLPPVYVN